VSVKISLAAALCGILSFHATAGGERDLEPAAVEEAVLAVNAEMSQAGEALDPERLFAFILDNDKGAVIQNGEVMATRQAALDRVKADMRGLTAIRYRWRSRHVTVLSPDVAVLAGEGESTATTAAGQTFTAPFAQTAVFVRRDGRWRVLHAHHSSPQRR
jgi:uncharacterized protein (TIGR02246 family)